MLGTKLLILAGFLAVAIFAMIVCHPIPEARMFDRE